MKISATQKHFFYSEIAKLLGAGFDIRKAAAVMIDTQLPVAQAALLDNLTRGLQAGDSITASLGRDSRNFGELERAIVGAGERGGKLAQAFEQLADYFGMLSSAHLEMVRGMIYPIIILHLGMIIAIVPSALMAGEMSFAQIFTRIGLAFLLLYATGFAGFLAIRILVRSAPRHSNVDRWINKIPWVGSARRNMAMARFSKVYHACLLAGISMSETVQLSAQAAQSGVIREAGERLVTAVKSGQALGPEFLAGKDFPKVFARSYSTGEEAGTLDGDLARWSKRFQEDAESSVRTLSTMIPKVLYFFILGFVAWKVVGFYSDYYSRLDQLGE